MTRELLGEVQVGIRVYDAINWPAVDQLWRTGTRSWEVVRELCNGVRRRTEIYKSARAARAAFEARIEGRKPNNAAPAPKRIAVRVTEQLASQIRAAAKKARLSRSAWVIKAIERDLVRYQHA